MPPTTVIFTAVLPEAKPLARRLRLGTVAPSAFANESIHLQITGMGLAAATQSARQLLTRLHPTRVLITGLCGALDPTLQVADVLHITQIQSCSTPPQTYTPTLSRLASTPCPRILLTADHLITTPAEKAQLHQQTGAHAVDMESAAIASVCDAMQIPFACIRAVSDTADQSLPAYLAEMVDPLGRPRTGKVIAQLLAHPSRIGTLMQIGRQSKVAAHALADAVAAACGLANPADSPRP